MTQPAAQPTLLDIAAAYTRRGLCVIPIPFRKKAPELENWPSLRLSEEDLPRYFNGHPANIGVLLGEPSGGLVDVDIDDPAAASWTERLLPATDAVFGRLGKPRSHWLYSIPGFASDFRFKPTLELRSSGKDGKVLQTVFPGSTHKDSGEPILWDREGEPAVISGEELTRRCTMVAVATRVAPLWPNGRHRIMLCLAGVLARARWTQDDVHFLMNALVDQLGYDNPKDVTLLIQDTFKNYEAGNPVNGFATIKQEIDSGLARDLKRWLRDEKSALLFDDEGIDLCSDIANAARFVDHWDDALRYVRGVGWLHWCGTHWQELDEPELLPMAGHTALRICLEAANAPHRDARARLLKHASLSQGIQRLRAMVAIAQGDETIREAPTRFDARPYLCNVRNGTLDVKTGELRAHDPHDRLTAVIDEDYDAAARSDQWERFLHRIFAGDTALIGWVQRALGYTCCTGSVEEDAFFLCYGTGANGKSTLLGTVMTLLGPALARKVPMHAFLEQRRDGGATPEVAQLRGVRLAMATEGTKGRVLDTERLKDLTGGEVISARRLHENDVNFFPTFKIWLSSNDKPTIRGQDTGTWRRVRMIPFTVEIPEADRDPTLKDRFKQDPAIRRAVLAWLVAGARAWATAGGLGKHPDIDRATNQLRAENDEVRRWVAERCERGESYHAAAPTLFRDYVAWVREEGGGVQLTSPQFNVELDRLGYARRKVHGGVRVRLGLRLRRGGGEEPF